MNKLKELWITYNRKLFSFGVWGNVEICALGFFVLLVFEHFISIIWVALYLLNLWSFALYDD